MKVYRFEKRNIGPYQNIYNHDIKICDHKMFEHYENMIRKHNKSSKHISVALYDYFKPSVHFSGFNSLEQINNWFTKKDIKVLFYLGYKFNTYEVDRFFVIDLKQQVIFQKSEAILINSENSFNKESI